MGKARLFNRWEWEGVEVRDPSLKAYINLKPIIMPFSHGRHAKKRFGKANVNIVERLINKLGITGKLFSSYHLRTSGRNTGKKLMHSKILYKAFLLIEKETNQTPIQDLDRAIENVAPLEDIIIMEYGGIAYPKAVDVSPQRRVDLALRWIAMAAYKKSVSNKKPLWYNLAWELIYASKEDSRSLAIEKRNERERQAAAAR